MYTDMVNYGLNNSYSSLRPQMNGASPDDAFSTIPYDKGFQFLTFLEDIIGEEKMQAFIRYYINTHAQTSITTENLRFTWEMFIEDNFSDEEI